VSATGSPGLRGAWLVVAAGGVAALQVGKLPPALPALQAELGLSLLQSGFLLSMVQLAGLTLAVFMGVWSDGMGLQRSMVRGLLLLALASAVGGLATSVPVLLLCRALEGLGLLLVALPAPALIRRLVPQTRLAGMLGVWGAYMPTGTALALLAGPLFIPVWGWSAWWGLFALVSLAMALGVARVIPADPPAQAGPRSGTFQRLQRTLGAPGPWVVALSFGLYSGLGFLPSIYAQAGVGGALLGVLTALAAAVNMGGNMASGRLLQRGWAAARHAVAGLWRDGAGQQPGFCGVHRGLALAALCGCAAVLGPGRPGAGHAVFARGAPGARGAAGRGHGGLGAAALGPGSVHRPTRGGGAGRTCRRLAAHAAVHRGLLRRRHGAGRAGAAGLAAFCASMTDRPLAHAFLALKHLLPGQSKHRT